jgi:hypothetical protein
MQWFRMYAEFASDPKVQMMPEVMQRRLVMLFCLQCSGNYETLSEEEIAFALRIDIETLHETFHLFQKRDFLDENRHIRNWNKRQFKSDNSTERVQKHREKTKACEDSEDMKRFRNVTETPQNRTEQNITEDYTSDFEIIWKLYPAAQPKGAKNKALAKYTKLRKDIPAEKIKDGVLRYAKFCKVTNQYNQHMTTWLNGRGWEEEWPTGKAEGRNDGII